MPSRPNLDAINSVAGSHVVTSGLHSSMHRSYGLYGAEPTASVTTVSQGMTRDALPSSSARVNEGGSLQSRFLVGSRGYSRASAWPVRTSQTAQVSG